MCQDLQTEKVVKCIDKRFVTVSDIQKCFGVGNIKAKKIFQKVVDDTHKDGKELMDGKICFDRVLDSLGIKKKDVFDDYDRLLKAQEKANGQSVN